MGSPDGSSSGQAQVLMPRSSELIKKLGRSGRAEDGFTLIELLIVMLILGLLAAISLPAFFNQKNKAGDAKAKEYVHSAQVTMETYSNASGGTYVGATPSALETIEPSLKSIGTFTTAGPTGTGSPTATGYKITVTSVTGNKFSVVNNAGAISFPCEVPTGNNRGGCPTGSQGWANG
jgi:type IV pilus assembly protein PilA